MAFLDNSGDIILDAVLTDLGRQRMARGDGSFKIAKFALSDDEIDYSLWNSTEIQVQADIERSPILEAFSNNSSTLKSFLVSYDNDDLLYLPVMMLNDANVESAKSVQTDSGIATGDGSNMFFVMSNEETKTQLGATYSTKSGFIDGSPSVTSLPHDRYIRIDQGINNLARPSSIKLEDELVEQTYEVTLDSRFARLHSLKRTPASVSFTDDDEFDYYYVDLMANRDFVSQMPAQVTGQSTDTQTPLLGSRGTKLQFSIGATLNLADNDYLFDLLGNGTVTIDSKNYKYIDSSVRVKGMTTGFSITVPVRYLKYTTS